MSSDIQWHSTLQPLYSVNTYKFYHLTLQFCEWHQNIILYTYTKILRLCAILGTPANNGVREEHHPISTKLMWTGMNEATRNEWLYYQSSPNWLVVLCMGSVTCEQYIMHALPTQCDCIQSRCPSSSSSSSYQWSHNPPCSFDPDMHRQSVQWLFQCPQSVMCMWMKWMKGGYTARSPG